MPHQRLQELLTAELAGLAQAGRLKGAETVFKGVVPAANGFGPRYLLEGHGDEEFLRMNSNGYLGLAMADAVAVAEEGAVRSFGVGPGAVRFISGTWAPHVALEQRLAAFHGREAAMIFSSAYAAMMGILPQLMTSETAVISDELNHNCIINAMRLARPKEKYVYQHLDLGELERHLQTAAQQCRRAIVVSDGIFSMRGDHAPLAELLALARSYDDQFAENVLVVIDDSHGVGAFGAFGRGTEEYTDSGPADILLATLGKAFGVNGGYVAASAAIVDYLRETSPFYVYSNPITVGEAAAAAKAVEIVDGPDGRDMLARLRAMAAQFEQGLLDLGLETILGEHPIVPLMVRDTARASALVTHLKANRILTTGLNYPIVPKGEEEIRFQISADHTAADLQQALAVLASFVG